MIEIGMNLLGGLAALLSKLTWGRWRTVFYLVVGSVVFFKPFVLRGYPLFGRYYWPLVWISILLGVVYIRVNSFKEKRGTILKIAFLIASTGLGGLSHWLATFLGGTPNMSGFIDIISRTSRLSWISIMCQWENIAPSFYFIAYFVSILYLFGCLLTSVSYLNGFINEQLLQDSFEHSLLMVVLVRSNFAYWFVSWLFMLLE